MSGLKDVQSKRCQSKRCQSKRCRGTRRVTLQWSYFQSLGNINSTILIDCVLPGLIEIQDRAETFLLFKKTENERELWNDKLWHRLSLLNEGSSMAPILGSKNVMGNTLMEPILNSRHKLTRFKVPRMTHFCEQIFIRRLLNDTAACNFKTLQY